MGNICRSPTAEAVFTQRIVEENIQDLFIVDSAGTHAYHVGEPPDLRSIKIGATKGYKLDHLVARQVNLDDFEYFDYLIVMDDQNYQTLLSRCPESLRHKITRLLSYLPDSQEVDVPDPYYSGTHGFQHVLELIESGISALLEHIKKYRFL